MRILGIEFGSWSLKAVEMESRFRRVDILDFHEVRLPLQFKDPTEAYRGAISQLMARLPSHPEKVVTSLPATQTALRFLSFPIKQRKHVEKTFRFELEDSVPFRLDDAIIEHYVSRTKEGSLVLAAIAPKRFVSSYLTWLNSVGVDPDWLTFEGMGIVNLLLAQSDPKKSPPWEIPVMLLDIGHTKTNMVVVEQDRIYSFRSIAWGGANITQSIAMSLGVALDEAERTKMNDLKLDEDLSKASGETVELVTAANDAFSPLITDLNHSMVALKNAFKVHVGSILLTGGSAKIWGIENYIRRNLTLPTRFFHPFDGMSLKEEFKDADEYRFAEPLGRALVFARKAGLFFNFRQQFAAKGTSLTEIRAFLKDPNVTRLLRFAGVLAIILFLHVMIASSLAYRESKAATEELKKAFTQTFPTVPTKVKTNLTGSPKDLKKFINQKNSELDQKLKMISKARVPMMGLIRGISEAFPGDVRVDVNVLQLDDRGFQMEGVLYSGDLNKVTDNLKKVASLNNVAVQRDGQRFTFRGEVVGR